MPEREGGETVCSLCSPGSGDAVPDLADAYLAQAERTRSEHWSGPPEMVERIARIVGTGPTDLVVDVGCGVGGPAARLSRVVGCRVVGVDVVEELVRIASERGPAGTSFVAGAADSIPLRPGIADQVWSLGVASHVPDHRAMVAERAMSIATASPCWMVKPSAASRAGLKVCPKSTSRS